MLAPTWRPDDIALLDNLSSHRPLASGRRSPCEARNWSICRPTLPIEQAFAKFKAALRHAAERTRDGLWQAIGRTSIAINLRNAVNFSKAPAMQSDRK
jgi:hypothetical protein